MKAIRDNAEVAVRHLFRDTAKRMGKTLKAVDHMDNGAGTVHFASSLALKA